MTAFPRYQFGKLVAAGGAIVPGFDYRCTGRSQGFPKSLESTCRPTSLGLGTSELFVWSNYPWPEGGVVTSPVVGADGPFVLAARVRPRSERGEGMPGRTYVESTYVAIEPGALTPLVRVEIFS